MQITLQSEKQISAFINIAGNKSDTSIEEHNNAVMAFIEQFNAGAFTIEAFTGKDGKIVLGFK